MNNLLWSSVWNYLFRRTHGFKSSHLYEQISHKYIFHLILTTPELNKIYYIITKNFIYFKTTVLPLNKVSRSASHFVGQNTQALRNVHQCCLTKPKVQSKPYVRSWDKVKGKSSLVLNFMLGWPCIMNYVYNNQFNALFILSLLN
jgi:hypothetical protein